MNADVGIIVALTISLFINGFLLAIVMVQRLALLSDNKPKSKD
jgi:tetrahydromethanopterin S-methyltransferase subunit F